MPMDTPDTTRTTSSSNENRRPTASRTQLEDPWARQQRLQRLGERDIWADPAPSSSHPLPHSDLTTPRASSRPVVSPPLIGASTAISPYMATTATGWPQPEWASRPARSFYEAPMSPPWPASPPHIAYSPDQMPAGQPANRASYGKWQKSWPPPPLLRRTSSDDTRLSAYVRGYPSSEGSTSAPSVYSSTVPQRRPSNRDEFDGPSQLLEKVSGESAYEPKEDDMPQLPLTLYAREQDEILSRVNDRLAQCAFDFVANYQFPIPIEPDKRPVRVPGDREWSEWVYLLKRLATKRRIPARVLYNGQIKQLITILENSLEMRHAAKHQSRPLKDDRNILQLISSGLQVAKILKDAHAMRYLDRLYVHTEQLIHSRKPPIAPSTENYAGT